MCPGLKGSGEVVVTQELIAGILGVRRESVTQVAGRLHPYRRGASK